MTDLSILIDKRRALAAQVAGVEIEICMALGDREGAQRAMREMNALVEARRAAVAIAECFFDKQGQQDRIEAVA